MIDGLLAGLLWGLDTVILGIALLMAPFSQNEQAIFLAPFISTFIHDFCSSMWILFYLGVRKQIKQVGQALKTKSGKYIVLAALLGGPLGMTGYVLAIKYIGPAYTAIISALFPAVGAFLSYLFLKEKMRWFQLVGLAFSIFGVIALGYTPGNYDIEHGWLGLLFAVGCVLGWSLEAVIIAYGLKEPGITDEQALQIRQGTSALFYGLIILPLLKAWPAAWEILPTNTAGIILLAAFFGTASYLFYYRAISRIGASKAMALNITYVAWAIGFGYALTHEMLTFPHLVWSVIIIAGSVVAGSKFEAK